MGVLLFERTKFKGGGVVHPSSGLLDAPEPSQGVCCLFSLSRKIGLVVLRGS